LGGLIFVHMLNLFSISYFIVDGALVGLGGEFEDAARLCRQTVALWFPTFRTNASVRQHSTSTELYL